jgi:hypothetical protein
VVPETLPFADKSPTDSTSVTVVAQASEKAPTSLIQAAIELLKQTGKFPDPMSVQMKVVGDRCYINWPVEPTKMHAQVGALAKLLQERGCKSVHFQIESGTQATLPPASN